MKLYLTQILKEANEFGFAANSGSAAPTSFAQAPVAPSSVQAAPSPIQTPAMQLPGVSGANPIQSLVSQPAKFTPTI